MNIKTGDRVRVTNPPESWREEHTIPVGTLGTVTWTNDPKDDKIFVALDGRGVPEGSGVLLALGIRPGWPLRAKNVELVEERKTFQVGDRVRVIKNPFGDEIAIGATGTVANVSHAGPLVRLDEYPVPEDGRSAALLFALLHGDPGLRDCHPFEDDELELIR